MPYQSVAYFMPTTVKQYASKHYNSLQLVPLNAKKCCAGACTVRHYTVSTGAHALWRVWPKVGIQGMCSIFVQLGKMLH